MPGRDSFAVADFWVLSHGKASPGFRREQAEERWAEQHARQSSGHDLVVAEARGERPRSGQNSRMTASCRKN